MLTNKLKILHILPDLGPGGAERMVVNLTQNLDRTRFDVAAVIMLDLVTPYLKAMLEQSDIPLWCLGKKRGFDPRMYSKIDEILRRFCPDIVHTHRYVLRYALPPMLWRRIKGKIHTVHNLAEKEVDALGRLVNRLAFRLGVIPVAIAAEVARSLEHIYGITNTSLIPNGIPLEFYNVAGTIRTEWRKKEGIREEDVVFVSVGRLTRQKNQQLLLKSFAKVSDVLKEGLLLLVGDGEKRHELEAETQVLGLGQRVRFLGVRSDIPDILAACDVFVLSSDWEGNPLSVMEAMAAGKPVVSTAVGGVPELVVDKVTGMLTPAGDATALAEALTVFLSDAGKRKEMGVAAFIRAEEKFCAKVMTKSYEELYEKSLVQI